MGEIVPSFTRPPEPGQSDSALDQLLPPSLRGNLVTVFSPYTKNLQFLTARELEFTLKSLPPNQLAIIAPQLALRAAGNPALAAILGIVSANVPEVREELTRQGLVIPGFSTQQSSRGASEGRSEYGHLSTSSAAASASSSPPSASMTSTIAESAARIANWVSQQIVDPVKKFITETIPNFITQTVPNTLNNYVVQPFNNYVAKPFNDYVVQPLSNLRNRVLGLFGYGASPPQPEPVSPPAAQPASQQQRLSQPYTPRHGPLASLRISAPGLSVAAPAEPAATRHPQRGRGQMRGMHAANVAAPSDDQHPAPTRHFRRRHGHDDQPAPTTGA